MDYLPATLKVLLVFLAVLIAIRRKFSLGNAFVAGAILMGLIFGLGPEAMLRSVTASIVYPKTLSLAVIVSLILILSSTMESIGQMKRLLAHFQGLIRRPILNLALFPALIGLLPMPGGAVFSAPMVKELGQDTGLPPDKMSFINYWYRHIWEYWWPLYPGVLLATALANLNLWTFVVTLLPLSVIAALSGSLSIRSDIRNVSHQAPPAPNARPSWQPFLRELVPVLLVIVAGLGTGAVLSALFPRWSLSKEMGLIVALCLTIVWLWRENGWPRAIIRKILTDTGLLNMMYMVIAILVFKGMLEDSHAVEVISREFRSLHIPLVLLVGLLPFLVGMVTGITIAFVGSTFPILILLIQSYGQAPFMLSYIMLAIVSGFIGVLFSPLHLCLLLTNQYFSCHLSQSYRLLWLPCLLLITFGSIYFYLLHYF